MGHYLLKDAPKTGTGDLLVSVQAIEPIRIPRYTHNEALFGKLLNQQVEKTSPSIDEYIDNIIFELYSLSKEEREYIKQLDI